MPKVKRTKGTRSKSITVEYSKEELRKAILPSALFTGFHPDVITDDIIVDVENSRVEYSKEEVKAMTAKEPKKESKKFNEVTIKGKVMGLVYKAPKQMKKGGLGPEKALLTLAIDVSGIDMPKLRKLCKGDINISLHETQLSM